jgi:hypothetical protein
MDVMLVPSQCFKQQVAQCARPLALHHSQSSCSLSIMLGLVTLCSSVPLYYWQYCAGILLICVTVWEACCGSCQQQKGDRHHVTPCDHQLPGQQQQLQEYHARWALIYEVPPPTVLSNNYGFTWISTNCPVAGLFLAPFVWHEEPLCLWVGCAALCCRVPCCAVLHCVMSCLGRG